MMDDDQVRGTHRGFDYLILSNDLGFRCGYVRIPESHPFFDKHYDEMDVTVHGGLTFGGFCEKDSLWGEGFWIGFDCGHCYDLPDPDEMNRETLLAQKHMKKFNKAIDQLTRVTGGSPRKIRSAGYVESQCRHLAEQCAQATIEGWVCLHCDSVMPEQEYRCLSCGANRRREIPDE